MLRPQEEIMKINIDGCKKKTEYILHAIEERPINKSNREVDLTEEDIFNLLLTCER